MRDLAGGGFLAQQRNLVLIGRYRHRELALQELSLNPSLSVSRSGIRPVSATRTAAPGRVWIGMRGNPGLASK